jgi:hypothetical protein
MFTQTLLLLTICGYFTIQRLSLQGSQSQTCNQSLHAWNCSSGNERNPTIVQVTDSTTPKSFSWKQQYEEKDGISTVVSYDSFSPEIETKQDSELSTEPLGDADAVKESSVSISRNFTSSRR